MEELLTDILRANWEFEVVERYVERGNGYDVYTHYDWTDKEEITFISYEQVFLFLYSKIKGDK